MLSSNFEHPIYCTRYITPSAVALSTGGEKEVPNKLFVVHSDTLEKLSEFDLGKNCTILCFECFPQFSCLVGVDMRHYYVIQYEEVAGDGEECEGEEEGEVSQKRSSASKWEFEPKCTGPILANKYPSANSKYLAVHPKTAKFAISNDRRQVVLYLLESPTNVKKQGVLRGGHTVDEDMDDVKITAVAFSPSGRLLVSGDDHGRSVVWNTETRTKLSEVLLLPDARVRFFRWDLRAQSKAQHRDWRFSSVVTERSKGFVVRVAATYPKEVLPADEDKKKQEMESEGEEGESEGEGEGEGEIEVGQKQKQKHKRRRKCDVTTTTTTTTSTTTTSSVTQSLPSSFSLDGVPWKCPKVFTSVGVVRRPSGEIVEDLLVAGTRDLHICAFAPHSRTWLGSSVKCDHVMAFSEPEGITVTSVGQEGKDKDKNKNKNKDEPKQLVVCCGDLSASLTRVEMRLDARRCRWVLWLVVLSLVALAVAVLWMLW